MLLSRKKYSSSENFRDEFLKSLTPGVIERANFIQWQTIADKREHYLSLLSFFRQLSEYSTNELERHFIDSILSLDNKFEIIKTGFELLGHTGDTYVSNEDNINFKKLKKSELGEEEISYLVKLLIALGIGNILDCELVDYFTGIQVGLETHRRKNVGGKAFVGIVRFELKKIVKNLVKDGIDIILTEEERIFYEDKITSKKVDFCLTLGGKKIGIEVNFYTSGGSKPTEIKRSYGQVNRELNKVNTELVWITDGIGYEKMKNSLKEARDIHKNTYNFRMMIDDLENDLRDFIN